MSGGHFQYMQNGIVDIATEIDLIVSNNDSEEVDEWGDEEGYHFPAEILEKFKEASHTLKQAAGMAQRVDWLVSGDDGEESFLDR